MDFLTALSDMIIPKAQASEGESYYNAGMERTKQNEGFRPTPYMDTVGVPTIGYGFNMQANPGLPQKMTREQADPYFRQYYKDADALAMRFAGDKWGGMTDAQKAVLTDMAYNLNGKLLKFKKMQTALQDGNDQGVKDEMQHSTWFDQVKSRGIRDVNDWTVRQ
jgi:lysozyme